MFQASPKLVENWHIKFSKFTEKNSLYPATAFFCFSIISGYLVAIIGIYAAIFIAALIGGLISLFVPLRHMYSLLIVSAFLIMGQLVYFARIDKALWLPFLLGLVIAVRYPGELLFRNKKSIDQLPFSPSTPKKITTIIWLYVFTITFSTALNVSNPIQIFVSAKEYFFLWSLYLIIAAGLISTKFLEKTWELFPWILPLQLPFILYQRFVVAARRAVQHLGAEWDAVVGAFGGDPDGGGSSGAMGIFIVFAITASILRWRQGTMKSSHCAIILISGLAGILLAEVKFAVLMLPVALAIAFRKEFTAKPIAALGWISVAVAIMAGIFMSYKLQYWNEAQETRNEGYAEHVLSSSTDSQFINFKTGEIGRVAALHFWLGQQTELTKILVGHGMGASRKGDLVTGDAAKPWRFNIARSSLAILLWETGVIGTFAFLLLLLFAYQACYKLTQEKNITESEKTILLACCAAIIVIILELPYNTDIFFSPQIQILFFLSLGQIAVTRGRLLQRPSEQQ